ncbi:MAG: anti-sigma factor family protein [Vulcanimicrobiaceae bacterium]
MNEHHFNDNDFIDYLHGELSPGRDAAMLAHLDACATCRSAYDEEARLGEMLRAHATRSERELPYGLTADVWKRIERESESPQWAKRLLALLRPAIAIPVAAAVVLAAYFGVTTLERGPARPSIDAAYYLNDHAALTRTVPFSEGGSVVPSTLASDTIATDQQAIAITGSASGSNAP